MGSDAAAGLGCLAGGALRFRDAGVRIGGGGGGAIAGAPVLFPEVDSEELAALLDALVTLGDMMCE